MLTASVFAQAPEKMSYHAVIRNSSNHLVTNQAIRIKISILLGSATGAVVYSETQTPSTNENGLVTIEIGEGAEIFNIDWANGPYFIKTETDPTGGINYTITGTSQLLSVPYAMYAIKAGNAFSGNYNDLLNKPLLFDGSWLNLTGRPSFSSIALSGSYFDLINRPSLFSGNYNDLTNKPVLFSGIWQDITGKPTTLSGYGITNGISTTHPSFGINSNMISNWNNAYGWGNHTGLYKTSSYIPAWVEITGKPSFGVVATTGSYSDLLNKPTLFDGTWASLTNKPTFAAVATSGTFVALLSKPTTLDGYGITNALSISHPANNITNEGINNWNTAYSWGNHATSGYQSLIAAGTNNQYWRGDKTWRVLDNSAVGLGNVENTKLSTWIGSSNVTTLGIITDGVWNAGLVISDDAIIGNTIVKTGGTASQFLKADGSVDANTYITAIREIADEFTAVNSQSSFTLTETPTAYNTVKMFINGVRTSNSAYTTTGNVLTYIPANNDSYVLVVGDRVQFDYYY